MSENKQVLFPCPFCGGEAESDRADNGIIYAGCCDPDCIGFRVAYDFTNRISAGNAWNRRAVLSASAGEKKVLEDLLPESLHTFLDVAGAEGLVFDGIDAGDLYKQLFPKRFEELAMSAPWRQQPQSASKSNQEQSTNKEDE